MAIVVQYVFMAAPEKSLARLAGNMNTATAFWKRHGALPRLSAVGVGQTG